MISGFPAEANATRRIDHMEGRLSIKYLFTSLIGVILSVFCAGITYFAWLSLFLLLRDSIGSLMRGIFWLAAPVATSLGFGVGILIHERVTKVRKATFHSMLLWPLFGCTVGAAAIFWKGPMLIVFGMFAMGAASVVVREFVLRAKEREDREEGPSTPA